MTESRIKRRGFASMDPARRREIAAQGGRAAHRNGTAFEWKTTEEARAAQARRKSWPPKKA
jgi:general stress protein YciG